MIIDEYGLSPMQEGMLFHHLSGEAPGVDIVQIVVGYNEPLDVELLERAWQLAVQRHPTLRTSLEWEQYPDPVQQVHDYVEVHLERRAARWAMMSRVSGSFSAVTVHAASIWRKPH
jgi:hypothetical protein